MNDVPNLNRKGISLRSWYKITSMLLKCLKTHLNAILVHCGGSRLDTLIYGRSEVMANDSNTIECDSNAIGCDGIALFSACGSGRGGTVRLINGTTMGNDLSVSKLQSIADGRAILSS